jgi:hypothetical protein
MKKLILLPFLFLLLAAKCQEPDLHGFTTEYVDSLQAIIDYQDSIINTPLSGNLSAEIVLIDGGLRFDFVDLSIDRRFHFYYVDKKRSVILGDSLKASGMFNYDWKD